MIYLNFIGGELNDMIQPKIIDFWEDVLHHRKIGIQDILDKREERKTKKIKIRKEKSKKNTFEIDKDIVEQMNTKYLILSDND